MSNWELFTADTPDDNERWLEEFRKWKGRRQARRYEIARAREAEQDLDDGLVAAAGAD
jgi:hypothetical protein